MFCYQCQEAAKGTGCEVAGVCGKKPETAALQDLLLYIAKGISLYAEKAIKKGDDISSVGLFVVNSLFTTITNANFDDSKLIELIKEGIVVRDNLKATVGELENPHDCATFTYTSDSDLQAKATVVGLLSEPNEDVRSLRELLTSGVKGLAAYVSHAQVLGFEDKSIYEFVVTAMASTTKKLSQDEMVGLVLKAGEVSVTGMALLDKANTQSFGNPEITTVNIGVGTNPGILISGHDLKDMEELLKQTEGSGVDIYTHSEMLPANYYPAFKKYKHFVGNYGNAWWKQDKEFASFNGPIIMTTNCIVPVRDSYKERIFTTGRTGFPGVTHIAEGEPKDFSEVIELAKKCDAPTEIEKGEIIGGFAHAQVFALADKVVDAVKSGAVKRFVVMAGCDGRHKSRNYYTDVANELPDDSIILTAGCAKYRYNKLDLGDIGGIPRVLDAGQCNDSYSLALIALKLQEIFKLEDINDLPISFDIAWYEQKAVTVLLALLHLGVKGIRLGPTLPAFLSPNVAKILIDTFDIKGITTAKEDVQSMMKGE